MTLITFALYLSGFSLIYVLWHKRRTVNISPYPPLVHIPATKIFSDPRQAYEDALAMHGPIIGVTRKGRLEYITDKTYVKEVLAQDHLFSFEQGAFQLLNIQFLPIIGGGSLFRDMDDVVKEAINSRMDEIVDRLFPIFDTRIQKYIEDACQHSRQGTAPDFSAFCHRLVVAAMTTVMFGGESDEQLIDVVDTLETNISSMMGMFQNTSFFARTFPRIWRIYSYGRILIGSILPNLYFVLGPKIWALIDAAEHTEKNPDLAVDVDIPLVSFLAKKRLDNTTGRVAFLQRLWIIALVAGFVFASTHNVAVAAVWMLYELARRPRYMDLLRTELIQVMEQDTSTFRLNHASLLQAKHLDSFIREVMRVKGDTLSQIRRATCDVTLGKYIIPKGSLITTLATTVHEDKSLYGDSASQLDGFRWVEQGKLATSIGTTYIPFGLGRFACPGRYLAVNEVKMITLAFIARSIPSLADGTFQVVDRLNTAAVGPTGTLILHKADDVGA